MHSDEGVIFKRQHLYDSVVAVVERNDLLISIIVHGRCRFVNENKTCTIVYGTRTL
jgi:hypothetical protein